MAVHSYSETQVFAKLFVYSILTVSNTATGYFRSQAIEAMTVNCGNEHFFVLMNPSLC